MLPAASLAVLVVVYALGYRRRHATRRAPSAAMAAAFLIGATILAAALVGPLDAVSDELFSAHMVQHLLITLVAPPLIAWGRPIDTMLGLLAVARRGTVYRALLGQPGIRRLLRVALHPILVAVVANGLMLVWHIPSWYSATLANELIHDLEHATIFWSALLYWMVLLGAPPRVARPPSFTMKLLMLFASWMASDLLGATLALSAMPLYDVYRESPERWGLTQLADQHMGGLIMWIGGGGLYAVMMLTLLVWQLGRGRAR